MIALRAENRRASAQRPAVEAAVAAGDDGRPDSSLGKPTLRKGRLPTGLPQRLGLRFAPSTATWKTRGVFHSYHNLDDNDRCTKIKLERRHRNTPFDRSKGTLHQRGLSLSPKHPSVPFRRNRCPFSSVSAPNISSRKRCWAQHLAGLAMKPGEKSGLGLQIERPLFLIIER